MTDATQSASAAPVADGTVLDGRFVLDEPVARTPAGVWYRGRHAIFGTPVRIFVAAPTDEAVAGALRSQARFARGLRLHRHMARVFDVGCVDGRSVVVEEPVDGADFATWVVTATPVETAAVGRQLAGALAASHAVGMVHGGVSADAVRVQGTPPTAMLRGFGTNLPGATARDDVQALAALLRVRLGDEIDAVVASPDAAAGLAQLDGWLAARVPAAVAIAPAIAPLAAAPEPPLEPPPPPPPPVNAAPPVQGVRRWFVVAAACAAAVMAMRQCERRSVREHDAPPVSMTTAAPATSVPATTMIATTLPAATTVPPTTIATSPATEPPTPSATVPAETPPSTVAALRWRSVSPAGEGEATAAVGEPLAFEAAVDGSHAAYRWLLDGVEVGQGRTWTLLPTTEQLGTTVVVRAEANADGGTAAREWQVRVEPAHLRVMARMPEDDVVTIAPGGELSFSLDVAVPATAGPVTFTWLRNGRVVASGQRPMWTLVSARSGDRRVAVTVQDGAGRTYGPFAWRTVVRDDADESVDDGDRSGDEAERAPRRTPRERPAAASDADGSGPRVLAASPGAGGIVPVRQAAVVRFAIEVAGGAERNAQWWLDGVRLARGRMCTVSAAWPVGTFHHLEVDVPGPRRKRGTSVFWTLQVVPSP